MKRGAGRISVWAVLVLSPLLLGASATSRILALYPQNREAQELGHLTAYLEGRDGKGVIRLKVPGGEVLSGQYQVGGSFSDLGLSRGLDRPGGAYTSAGKVILDGSPLIIDIKGPRGSSARCELMNDNSTAHGSGVCLFSNGAEFRVLY